MTESVSCDFTFDARNPVAMSINVIRNDTGKQKQTRIERVERMKRKIIPRNSGRQFKSISQTPMKVASIPMIASAASETIPVLVTI